MKKLFGSQQVRGVVLICGSFQRTRQVADGIVGYFIFEIGQKIMVVELPCAAAASFQKVA